MKKFHFPKFRFPLIAAFIIFSSFRRDTHSAVDLNCVKVHKATNTCHFNFTIDGVRYRYVDNGCRYNRKHDQIVKMANEGSLALAKDWKIDCQTESHQKSGGGS